MLAAVGVAFKPGPALSRRVPEATDVVTSFLRNRGAVLLLHRASDASTYPERWGAVTGYVEHDDPVATARMEIREETGVADFDVVRVGDSFAFTDESSDRTWRVHPVLVDVPTREVALNEESRDGEWTSPTEIRRRETVPELWTSYDRVRPTPESIAADDDHGSAAISIHALEVLRDEAGLAAVEDREWGEVRDVAEALLDARPSMAALRTRVNRVMANAETPDSVETAAIEEIERAIAADDDAADLAAEHVRGKRVFTLSRSGTVLEALRTAEPEVLVAESRPAKEGVGVAEELAGAGLDVTLSTDAAIAHLLATEDVDVVLVGADTILADGRVVNKTGTRGAALAARNEDVRVLVVAASDKISPGTDSALESGPAEAVYDGDAALDVANPTFDVTPAACVDAVLTERGGLDEARITAVSEEHAALARWRESG